MARVVIIGSGFGGISAAAYLARDGHEVTVFEKNAWVGGRARTLQQDGFTFDMGPSWYWMPAEHDRWFDDLGHDRRDYYQIHRVDPSYRAYFGDVLPNEPRNVVDMPADAERAAATPFGGTIAHGFLSLSLIAYLIAEAMPVPEGRTMTINYGSDKVRYLTPVRVGKRIRALQTILEAGEKQPGRWLVKTAVTIEIEGEATPALIAEILFMHFTG